MIALGVITLVVVFFETSKIPKQGLDVNRSTLYLVTALSGHKNLVSGLMLLLLPFCLMGYFRDTGSMKNVSLAVGITLFFGIAFLQTRAAWLAIVASAAFGGAVWMLAKGKQNLSWVQSASVIGLIFLGSSYFAFVHNPAPQVRDNAAQQAAGQSGRSVEERLLIWQKTGQMIQEKPLQGVGSGDWRIEFPNIGVGGINRLEIMVYAVNRPHNDFLWVWAETGLIGLLLYLSIFGLAIWQALQGMRAQENVKEKAANLFVAAGLVAYMSFAFLDFPLERIEHQVLLGLLLALAVHLGKPLSNKLPVHAFAGAPFYGISVVLLGLNLYMGSARYSGETHSKLLEGFKEQNNWPQVIQEANAAKSDWYKIEPGGNPIDWQIGVAHFNSGNIQASIEAGLAALEVTPYRPEVLNNLGSAYFQLKQFEKAIPLYQEALRANSGYDEAMFNLAAVYINTDRPELAVEWLNRTKANPEKKQQFLQIIANRQASKSP